MGKTADTETATYDVLSRLRHDGKRYGVGESVELTAKQHAQAFASGAVSEEPVDLSEADGDGDGGGDDAGTKETKPPAKKKAVTKKATTKKAAVKKATLPKPDS